MRSRIAFLTLASIAASSALAHHSFAPHFDSSKPVSISGTVTEYEARNPHSYVHIAAADENGKTQEYICESHGYTQLTRNGVARSRRPRGTHPGEVGGELALDLFGAPPHDRLAEAPDLAPEGHVQAELDARAVR